MCIYCHIDYRRGSYEIFVLDINCTDIRVILYVIVCLYSDGKYPELVCKIH